jgi:hypothetical protein
MSQLVLKAHAQPYHLPFTQHGTLLIITLHKHLTARNFIITLHKHLTARNLINYYFAQTSYCTKLY